MRQALHGNIVGAMISEVREQSCATGSAWQHCRSYDIRGERTKLCDRTITKRRVIVLTGHLRKNVFFMWKVSNAGVVPV